jgi:hypothetical protein
MNIAKILGKKLAASCDEIRVGRRAPRGDWSIVSPRVGVLPISNLFFEPIFDRG